MNILDVKISLIFVSSNELNFIDTIRICRYQLQFEASRGYSSRSDVAIDDISLSPECFAIGNFNII